MVNDLKYFDGSVQQIERIPDDLKSLYRTAFEIEPECLIEAASRSEGGPPGISDAPSGSVPRAYEPVAAEGPPPP